MYHKSVLVNEVLEYLAPKPGGVYIDATFGGGGHTRAILEKEPTSSVIAFDWDKIAIETNGPALQEEFGDRLRLIWGNFGQMGLLLKKHKINKVDGILADFGTSQFQIKEREGFSFARSTPLDMRMSQGHYKVTAADIVNFADEKELVHVFGELGEEPASRTIARALIAARKGKKIRTTGDLVDIILSVKPYREGHIHPATRVFQALRIAVNKELENIHSFLITSPQVLNAGGRLVCISFHSLEDRLVKQFIRDHAADFKNLTPKVVMATEQEVKENPSSRSARLRAAQRLI